MTQDHQDLLVYLDKLVVKVLKVYLVRLVLLVRLDKKASRVLKVHRD